MQNTVKHYFIPVNGNPVEVNEETYRDFYRPIWRTRYHAQKNGECVCPKSQLWKCDGICPGCRYNAAGRKVSLNAPICDDDPNLTLEDVLESSDPSPESVTVRAAPYRDSTSSTPPTARSVTLRPSVWTARLFCLKRSSFCSRRKEVLYDS